MKMSLIEIVQDILSETKACSKCAEVKPLEDFKKNSKCKGGRTGSCKSCVNKYLQDKRSQGLCKANRVKANACNRRYYVANKDKLRAKSSSYQRENRAKYNSYEAKRRARLLLATVEWSCEEAINLIYEEAKLLGMEVDHIVPLQGRDVCGLHCEDNLQLLTPTENRVKGNRI